MVGTPHAFTRRARDRAAERQETPFVIRTIGEDENGDEIVIREDQYTALTPSEELMLAAYAEGAREGATMADQTAAIFDLLRACLSEADFRRLYKRFKDPNDSDVDAEFLEDLFDWLTELWSDFPTRSGGASSKSQTSTGRRSTGRVHSKGSTR